MKVPQLPAPLGALTSLSLASHSEDTANAGESSDHSGQYDEGGPSGSHGETGESSSGGGSAGDGRPSRSSDHTSTSTAAESSVEEAVGKRSREVPPPDDDDESTDESADVAEDEGAGYELPLDQVFEILKNSRRRETLRYLHDHEGEGTLSDLAEHIAAIENDTTVRAISSSQRKRVYVGLYQCHLPKMDDTDVIEFDQNRGTIELGPNAAQLDEYLEEPETREWHKLYISVAFAGTALFAVGLAGGASFGLTPTVVLLALLVGIVGCSMIHFWHVRE